MRWGPWSAQISHHGNQQLSVAKPCCGGPQRRAETRTLAVPAGGRERGRAGMKINATITISSVQAECRHPEKLFPSTDKMHLNDAIICRREGKRTGASVPWP